MVSGIIEGNSRKDAIVKLKKTGLIVTKLKEYDKSEQKTWRDYLKPVNININVNRTVKEKKGDGSVGPLSEEQFNSLLSVVKRNIKKKNQEEIYEVDVNKIQDEDFIQTLDAELDINEEELIDASKQKNTNILTADINMDLIKSIINKEKKKGNEAGKKRLKKKKVKAKEVMMFTKQFAVLLETGIPLIKGLQLMVQQTKNQYFQKVLAVITKDVAEGYNLSISMAKFLNVFDEYYITMVATGEATGELSETLNLLYEYQFNKQKLRSKVVSASIYPLIIFFLLIIGIIAASVFVMPNFVKLFANMELPFITRMVFGALTAIGKNIHFIILGIVLFVIGFKIALKNPYVKYTVDYKLLQLPVFGKFLKEYQMTNVLKTLYISLKNGIPLTKSLEITMENTTNFAIKYELRDVLNSVIQGVPMSMTMQNKNVFPDLVVQMIKTGEESGKMQDTIDKTCNYFVWSVDNFVEKASKWIEPIMIIFVAVFVVLFVFAIAVPLFSISSGEIGI